MDTSSEHIVAADYVDGNLSGPAREAAEAHLAGCALCREAVAARTDKNKTDPLSPEAKPHQKPVWVLLPRFANRIVEGLTLLGRFGLVVGLTIGTLWLPTPEGLSPEGHRALAALVFTASVLALQPVGLPIAALMVPVVQVVLGIGSAEESFAPFSRLVVFLIL